MKIRTPSDLKFWHLELNKDSHFFDHKTLKFFGDTMRNYGIKTHKEFYELLRKKPVKHGLWDSAYFDKQTLKQIRVEL